jgi:putative lipoic acid-binding regulatory protein
MSKVLYTGVFLTQDSANALQFWWTKNIGKILPDVLCHHLTLQFKPSEKDLLKNPIGEMCQLHVVGHAQSNLVQAVVIARQKLEIQNDIPHVTVAIDKSNGGKPNDSNRLLATGFEHCNGLILFGRVGIALPNKISYKLEQ